MKTITIDPVTRLEGHGRIDIVLDEAGEVQSAHFIATEFRGFEQFCVGRPAEEMPRITSRICGVCPTAHHIAATRALDDLYGVEPPPAARAARELAYMAFLLEDHLLHLFVLAGPDLVLGPEAPVASRNILGLVAQLETATVRKLIAARQAARGVIALLGGKAAHPVMGLPGGVSRRPPPEVRALARQAAELGRELVGVGRGVIDALASKDGRGADGLTAEHALLPTYYLGLVDSRGRASFTEGALRIVAPDGAELASFPPQDYLAHIAERVERHDYIKRPYLRQVGWQGRVAGQQSGMLRVGPLARINVVEAMVSPAAERERQTLLAHFGGAPVHHTMAYHWARLVECLEACDRLEALAQDPALDEPTIRTPVGRPRGEGIAAVEAPRGTLLHHYRCDEAGLLTEVNLIVATTYNAAAIDLSVEQAARALIRGGQLPDEALLNRVEMAFRAYDPCLACATHALPGKMPLELRIMGPTGELLRRLTRSV